MQEIKRSSSQGVTVTGAGLAGCEAAYQLGRRGIPTVLLEMRPEVSTPVHRTALPAELVCSNSLGSDDPSGAPGLLKQEMRKMGSLIMEAADACRVPAGQALAVDREKFSLYIREKLLSISHITLKTQEAVRIPRGPAIIATGPLTSDALCSDISSVLGRDYLYFYDAVSPIVSADSIDTDVAFAANRYGRGSADYLNCPMTGEQYGAFYHELMNAERIDPEGFELGHFFSGCMPVEEMARRGEKTLLFGPLKPVGLKDDAEAVVQLRRENREGTMYSLVGFQTRLRWGEQKRVFRMIPGLEKAEFLRYGVMHRNIYADSPRVLTEHLQLKCRPGVFMAGQITGVEGYTESAAMGLLAGLYCGAFYRGIIPEPVPRATVMGSLVNYLTDGSVEDFQPMNANFGILPPFSERAPKKQRREKVREIAEKALETYLISDFYNSMGAD